MSYLKRAKKIILLTFLFTPSIVLLHSCYSEPISEKNMVSVMIENGEGFFAYDSILTQPRETDFTFKLKLNPNTFISWVSYELYSTEKKDDFTYITFEDVNFPTVVTIKTTTDFVVYHGDGGTFSNGESFLESGKNENHLRFNTLSGNELLHKKGYFLDGWQTIDGKLISIGSKANRKIKHLKAKWVKETSVSEFQFEEIDGGYAITKYIGCDEEITVPSYYKNKKVIKILKNAFSNLKIKYFRLSSNISSIENDGFSNCLIENFYYFDNIIDIRDLCFNNSKIKTIKINATRRPRYSGTFYDTFSDKLDFLSLNKTKKKIVLFSGSSTRYGYDSDILKEYFPEYEVINMGVYAYFSAKIQLDIIEQYLMPGDIIIDAPEFDAAKWQMFDYIDFEKRIFNMFESDYDNLKKLDLRNYNNFFDSFYKFQLERNNLAPLDYNVTALHLDDDGNFHEEEIYNINGDFILDRNGDVEEGIISQHPLAYKIGQISNAEFASFNDVYNRFRNKGIKMFFNYAPRNIDSLTKDSTISNRKLFEEQIKNKIEAPFLSTMDDFLYPANHFYLIDNHLTSLGVKKRTLLTAKNLVKMIND